MAGYNAFNDPEQALRVWDRMNRNTITPDLWSYVEAADSYIQLGDQEQVQRMIDGIYTKATKELVAHDQIQPLEIDEGYNDEEFDLGGTDDSDDEPIHLRKREQGPALELWNQVLSRFVSRWRMKESFEVWRRMREEAKLEPDTTTARLLIQVAVKNKRMDRATLVVANMRQYHNLKVGFSPYSFYVKRFPLLTVLVGLPQRPGRCCGVDRDRGGLCRSRGARKDVG